MTFAMWEEVIAWLLSLGEEYGVDPVVYAVIYIGAAPLFFASVGWLVRTLRRRGPIALPLLSTAVFFSLPTLYVFAAGRDLRFGRTLSSSGLPSSAPR